MELKEKLVALRKEKGLTQLAVAEKLDVSRQAKAIQKLAEHRDIKLMVKEIGETYGIDIQSTEGNSHLGDFSYPKEDEQKLIAILDRYLKD